MDWKKQCSNCKNIRICKYQEKVTKYTTQLIEFEENNGKEIYGKTSFKCDYFIDDQPTGIIYHPTGIMNTQLYRDNN